MSAALAGANAAAAMKPAAVNVRKTCKALSCSLELKAPSRPGPCPRRWSLRSLVAVGGVRIRGVPRVNGLALHGPNLPEVASIPTGLMSLLYDGWMTVR